MHRVEGQGGWRRDGERWSFWSNGAWVGIAAGILAVQGYDILVYRFGWDPELAREWLCMQGYLDYCFAPLPYVPQAPYPPYPYPPYPPYTPYPLAPNGPYAPPQPYYPPPYPYYSP